MRQCEFRRCESFPAYWRLRLGFISCASQSRCERSRPAWNASETSRYRRQCTAQTILFSPAVFDSLLAHCTSDSNGFKIAFNVPFSKTMCESTGCKSCLWVSDRSSKDWCTSERALLFKRDYDGYQSRARPEENVISLTFKFFNCTKVLFEAWKFIFWKIVVRMILGVCFVLLTITQI